MMDNSWSTNSVFTLSTVDLQWPELADLLDIVEAENSITRSRAVIESPCMTNWFLSACHGLYECFCGCSEGH